MQKVESLTIITVYVVIEITPFPETKGEVLST